MLGRMMQENEALWRGPARRIQILKSVLCAALLSGLALSPMLWTSNRGFPTAPAIDGLPDLPQALSLLLTGLLILTTLAIAILPRPRVAIYCLLALITVLLAFDINRLQPWVYQYALMFLAMAVGRSEKDARAICAFIVVALYLWSGVQKANATFVGDVFPWLVGPFGGKSLNSLAYAVPALEAAVGVLLVFPRTRPWGLAGAVAMHGFLLLALGPLGRDANSSVWPWNFWMIAIACVLFFREPEPIIASVWRTAFGKAVIVLVGVLPALKIAGLWDDYLSASLYSGKFKDGWITLSDAGAADLLEMYPEAKPFVADKGDNVNLVDVTRWAIAEVNAPPYGEFRVYRALAGKLPTQGLFISRPKSLTNKEREFVPVPLD